MTVSRLNLLTALLSLIGALVALFLGNALVGLLWLAITLVWLLLAVRAAGKRDYEHQPFSRLARRLSRLLLWGS